MKLSFLWHSKVVIVIDTFFEHFLFWHTLQFLEKEKVSLCCNEKKKNTKGVSPLTKTDSPIRKTFTGNVSSTYNFCFSSDQNLPHALVLERMASQLLGGGFPRIMRSRIFRFQTVVFCLNSKRYTFLHWGIVFVYIL